MASLKLKFITDETQVELITKSFITTMQDIDEERDYMQNYNSQKGYHEDDENKELAKDTNVNQEPKQVLEDVQEIKAEEEQILKYTENPHTPLSKNSRDILLKGSIEIKNLIESYINKDTSKIAFEDYENNKELIYTDKQYYVIENKAYQLDDWLPVYEIMQQTNNYELFTRTLEKQSTLDLGCIKEKLTTIVEDIFPKEGVRLDKKDKSVLLLYFEGQEVTKADKVNVIQLALSYHLLKYNHNDKVSKEFQCTFRELGITIGAFITLFEHIFGIAKTNIIGKKKRRRSFGVDINRKAVRILFYKVYANYEDTTAWPDWDLDDTVNTWLNNQFVLHVIENNLYEEDKELEQEDIVPDTQEEDIPNKETLAKIFTELTLIKHKTTNVVDEHRLILGSEVLNHLIDKKLFSGNLSEDISVTTTIKDLNVTHGAHYMINPKKKLLELGDNKDNLFKIDSMYFESFMSFVERIGTIEIPYKISDISDDLRTWLALYDMNIDEIASHNSDDSGVFIKPLIDLIAFACDFRTLRDRQLRRELSIKETINGKEIIKYRALLYWYNRIVGLKHYLVGLLNDLNLYKDFNYFYIPRFTTTSLRMFTRAYFLSLQGNKIAHAFILFKHRVPDGNKQKHLDKVIRATKLVCKIPVNTKIPPEMHEIANYDQKTLNEKTDRLIRNYVTDNFDEKKAFDIKEYRRIRDFNEQLYYIFKHIKKGKYNKIFSTQSHLNHYLYPSRFKGKTNRDSTIWYELDANASGLQIIAMGMNNKELGILTNLEGNDKEDIYLLIINMLDESLKHVITKEEQYFLRYNLKTKLSDLDPQLLDLLSSAIKKDHGLSITQLMLAAIINRNNLDTAKIMANLYIALKQSWTKPESIGPAHKGSWLIDPVMLELIELALKEDYNIELKKDSDFKETRHIILILNNEYELNLNL